jgi:hypothetical protein
MKQNLLLSPGQWKAVPVLPGRPMVKVENMSDDMLRIVLEILLEKNNQNKEEQK